MFQQGYFVTIVAKYVTFYWIMTLERETIRMLFGFLRSFPKV
jgi:hypothetical protein